MASPAPDRHTLPGQTDVILPLGARGPSRVARRSTQQRLGRGVSPEGASGRACSEQGPEEGKSGSCGPQAKISDCCLLRAKMPGHSVRFGWFDLWEHHRVDFVVLHLMDGALRLREPRHLPTVTQLLSARAFRWSCYKSLLALTPVLTLSPGTGPWLSLHYQRATLTSRAADSDTRGFGDSFNTCAPVL